MGLLPTAHKVIQKGLADAKWVSAQCNSSAYMNAPSEEIYSKSTTCDFQLMVNNNRCRKARITYRCGIFSLIEGENRHFRPLYSDCRPIADERAAM